MNGFQKIARVCDTIRHCPESCPGCTYIQEEQKFACLLYLARLSYRDMTLQTCIIHACYRSVHCWVQQLKSITWKVERKPRRFVAINETKHKMNVRKLFVWSAINIETKELLAVYPSYRRSSINSLVFANMVLRTCEGKPVILADGLMVFMGSKEIWSQMAQHYNLARGTRSRGSTTTSMPGWERSVSRLYSSIT